MKQDNTRHAGNEEGAQYQSATKGVNDEQLSAVSMT